MAGFVEVLPALRPGASKRRTVARCQDSGKDRDGLPAAWPMLNRHIRGDEIVRTISQNGEVTCRAVTASGLVNAAATIQGTTPVASAALGRAIVCTLLLSAGKKGKETVQLELRGDGPLKTVVAISNGQSEVRGYVGDPSVQLSPNRKGHLDVGRAVGRGILSVVRNHPMWKNPYTGLTSIVSGEVAEDVAAYLADSEQTPSALGAGVYVGEHGEVTAAGGFLVQMLPGATEESISIAEQNIRDLNQTPTELIRSGLTAREVVTKLMKNLDPLELHSNFPKYYCSCGRSRVIKTVALLGAEDVKKLIQEQGCVEATCEFCKRTYRLTPEEAEEAINQASK